MTHIDLFSGIGGFALAAHWAGYTTDVFCERDPFCQGVLRKHWPDVPVVADIVEFDGNTYRGVDLLTGGFPCQPYSCAGKRGGNNDDRALWPEMRRIISEARPRWVLAENVTGFISMALDGVLSDLESEGYAVQTVVIPACAVNAQHRRDRVWIVAHADQAGRIEQRRPIAVAAQDPSAERFGRGQPEPGLGRMADGLPARLDGHFAREPAIPRTATGIPHRTARLKALGNAIVPQVAFEIIRHLGNRL
jgi:DNA (cytosine-5)-methyltransferase 1